LDQSITIPAGEHRKDPVIFRIQESSHLCVQLEQGARAIVVCLCIADGEKIALKQTAAVAAGAHLHWINITVGDGIEQSLTATCTGDSAVSAVDWVFRAGNSDRQKLSVRNVFASSHGGGEITMKGVAEDSAHIGASGMIEIGLHGGGTHTYLTQNVLMLDPTAKVDAIPGLEIKTNDVKASHSATVSRVTSEDLFYFAARGIEETIARQMYIEGFLVEVVDKIEDSALQEEMKQVLFA
jgi:Fe-S cluster assembly scaffold protein SufB